MLNRFCLFVGVCALFFAGSATRAIDTGAANSLWVAEQGGVIRLSSSAGDLALEISDVAEVRAVAVDLRRQTLWALAGGTLYAYDFTGRRQLAVPLATSESVHAEMAVIPSDGSLWLAVGKDLRSVGASGQILHTAWLAANVVAVDVEPTTDLVWVATATSVEALDATSGAPVRPVSIASGKHVVDIGAELGSGRVWVALGNEVQLLDSAGAVALSRAIDDVTQVASDMAGGAWIATTKTVMHLSATGVVVSTTQPFGGVGVIGLLAPAGDGTVWAANQSEIAHLDANGSLLQRLSFEPPVRVRGLAVNGDATPPQLSILAPIAGACLADVSPTIELEFSDVGWGAAVDSLEISANSSVRETTCSAAGDRATCDLAAPLPEGPVTLSATIQDYAGNLSASVSTQIALDVTAPQIAILTPLEGTVTHERDASIQGTLSESATLTLQGSPLAVGSDLTFAATVSLVDGDNLFTFAAIDCAGNRGTSQLLVIFEPTPPPPPPGGPPPDPATIATPLDPTVAPDIAADTAFLYASANPVQRGMAPGTIEARRAAVVRGIVRDRDGAPLPGVAVKVVDRPEYGTTESRDDGGFDLAVNGAGRILLRLEKAGHLPVLRAFEAEWRAYTTIEDVVMTALDETVTPVAAGQAALQVARGSAITDASGARQATLLFKPGTHADMVLPDGTRQPLQTLSLRATEYTAGAVGARAMPAPLPPSSAYTYAVELGVDEAAAAGADTVELSQPVSFYVENFLGFPVGGPVPVGYLNRKDGRWEPASNGRIIKILGVVGGLAQVDLFGAGATATATQLAAAGFSDAERAKLATLYPVGRTLWRVALPHFSAVDLNWAASPPPGAEKPNRDAPDPIDEPIDHPTCSSGSIIECENQTLGEDVGIAGSPYHLSYRSDRTSARSTRRLRIPLTGATVPASLKRVELRVTVAGSLFSQTFATSPNQTFTFEWNGRDAYGRWLPGTSTATVRIGYVYDAVYSIPPSTSGFSFGLTGSTLTGVPSREEITLWQTHQAKLRSRDLRPLGMVGWSLSAHHTLDPEGSILLLGDGQARTYRTSNLSPAIPGPAGAITFDSSGNMYALYRLTSNSNSGWVIDRIAPDGTTTRVAGNGTRGFSGDGGPAINGSFENPINIVVDSAGNIYVSDWINRRVRRIDPSGRLDTIAGNGAFPTANPTTDGANALTTPLSPWQLALDPQERLYIWDASSRYIYRLDGGRLRVIAGIGDYYTKAFMIDHEGNLWYETASPPFYNSSLVMRTPEGVHRGIPHDYRLNFMTAMVIFRDGEIWLATPGLNQVQRLNKDGDFLAPIQVTNAARLAFDPTGTLWIGNDKYRGTDLNILFFRYGDPVPAYAAGGFKIPWGADGVFEFDRRGRHMRTLSSLTNTPTLSFTYDSAGRPTVATDGSGNATRLEYAAGHLSAIVAPFGQRTTIGQGPGSVISEIGDPAGGLRQFIYGNGLMTSMRDPRGNLFRFEYDGTGRLKRDTDPAGGFKLLDREETETGFRVDLTTALGLRTGYVVERLSSTSARRTTILPPGIAVTTERGDDESFTTTLPDGSSAALTTRPSQRFGALAHLPADSVLRTPAGLELRRSYQLSEALSNPLDPASLQSSFERFTTNGRVFTRSFDAAQRRFVLTSPAFRSTVSTVDSQGRPLVRQFGSLAALTFTYDTRGRLARLSRGTGAEQRDTTYEYGPEGLVSSIVDAIGRRIGLSYDANGRLTEQALPDGRTVHFSYDNGGNLVEIAPPGRPGHRFSYTTVDQAGSYDPPALASVSESMVFRYDVDRRLTELVRPDGGQVIVGHDGAGRVENVTFSRGQLGVSYDQQTGRLRTLTAPGNSTLSYDYDGFLLTRSSWNGVVTGSVERAYSKDLRVASRTVNGANPIVFEYDADGLLSKAGAVSFSRDGNGMVIGETLGSIATTYQRNAFGEVTQTTSSFSGAPFYATSYTRDKIGRIIGKVETVAGASASFDYAYDLSGRLVTLIRDGSVLAHYGYDDNGNRNAVTSSTGTLVSTVDSQDRLLQSGDVTYTYTAAGELLSKSQNGFTMLFDYDELGSLRGVTLPDGLQIDYVVDGRGRRIGKRIAGALVRGYLYDDRLRVAAELDGTGAVVSRFVYATQPNVPEYMIKGGVQYRILTDHLGSPRLVVSTSDGSVTQRIDYDEFGRVTLNTNPGFQPFGFAGGLYDHQTGLVRFGARDYDPEVGRWTAKDPLLFGGRSANLYTYVQNDPINLVDPVGLTVTCVYNQTTGNLNCTDDDTWETVVDEDGYSGRDDGLDNTRYDCVENTGPPPIGWYDIGPLADDPGGLGRHILPLTPWEETDMCGRSGFYIHGDNANQNNTASHGCIIMPLAARDAIDDNGGGVLHVVPW